MKQANKVLVKDLNTALIHCRKFGKDISALNNFKAFMFRDKSVFILFFNGTHYSAIAFNTLNTLKKSRFFEKNSNYFLEV